MIFLFYEDTEGFREGFKSNNYHYSITSNKSFNRINVRQAIFSLPLQRCYIQKT
jgi:hypothetical protein